MKEAWVLRLKDDSKEEGMVGEYYFNADDEKVDWVTDDLQKATIYEDKEKEIELMKEHESSIIKKYGGDSVINFGYTNMMKHFVFVEVKIGEVD